MRYSVKFILGIVAFAFSLSAFDATPVLADGHMMVIKERKALMKKVVKATRIIKKYKKGKASDSEAIAAKALKGHEIFDRKTSVSYRLHTPRCLGEENTC